jgi:hypothetical protein
MLFHAQARYRFPFVDVTFMILTASLPGHLSLSKVKNSKLARLLRPAEAL